MLGAHSEPELRRLPACGHHLSTDFYWKPGMASCAQFSSLPAQMATATPTAPPAGGQRVAIRGTVLSFSIQADTGLISGANGLRFHLVSAGWGSTTMPPTVGMAVEFAANGGAAEDVFPIQSHAGACGGGEFYRGSDNAIRSGVCAGLAHKWNTDPALIRIAMLFMPLGWIIYIIGSMSWSARPTRQTARRTAERGRPARTPPCLRVRVRGIRFNVD
jgi:phage shock protein PspC (stress-responsive transcriptional regulator)